LNVKPLSQQEWNKNDFKSCILNRELKFNTHPHVLLGTLANSKAWVKAYIWFNWVQKMDRKKEKRVETSEPRKTV